MHQQNAIVIGSGVAGLAVAIRLASQGYQVSVYEKNLFPGGKLHSFEKDGFHFDAGPSLFTQPQNIVDLFADAGERLEEYLTWEPVPLSCRYFFENGKQLDAFTDAGKLAEEMHHQLGEDAATVTSYLNQSEKLYEHVGKVFLNHSLHKKNTWLHPRVTKALSTVQYPHLFSTLHKYNVARFRTPEAVQFFDRFATYNGSDPYQAPAMLSLIPHLEINEGTFYPHGGMVSITEALYKLAQKKGVQFHFNQPIERILYHESKVRGVVVDSENIPASIVVSNADVYFTYKHLLKDDTLAAKVLRQERSSSAVIFYWGMRKSFPRLHLHNLFFGKNYEQEFDHIFKKGSVTDDPTIYINITSKLEVAMAPAGKENWFVMINVPANKGQDWHTLKTELREAVIQKLSRMLAEDIAPQIETELTLDPVSIEAQSASFMGSLYGTSSNSKMAAFMRQANESKQVKGLYFCGGSVHPGGGIPLCLKSAVIVSDLVKAAKQSNH